MIDTISKIKKSGGTSRDRDQGRRYKSGIEKRKLKQVENEILKKHTKITFLKSNTGEVNKVQEIVEERIEEEVCASVQKRAYPGRKVIFLTFFCNPFMH